MPANPTSAQSETSRRNGARSRGPRTQEGRARIARAATRHGLIGRFVLLPGEARAFRRLRASWMARFAPRDEAEAAAVDKLVAAIWRERRLEALESRLTAALIAGEPTAGLPQLATLIRYRARIERDRRRALAELAFARRLAARALRAQVALSAAREGAAEVAFEAQKAEGAAAGATASAPTPGAAQRAVRATAEAGDGRRVPSYGRAQEKAAQAAEDAREALLGEVVREALGLGQAGLEERAQAASAVHWVGPDARSARAPIAWQALDAFMGASFGAPLSARERARLLAALERGSTRAARSPTACAAA